MIVIGKEALDHKYAQVAEVATDSAKLTFDMLRPLGVFKWLLTPAQTAKSKEWLDAAMKDVPDARKKAPFASAAAKSSSSSSSSSKDCGNPAKKRKTDLEQAVEFADSLF